MRLYAYVLRRLALMGFILLVASAVVFYLTRGPLPPASVLAPYLSPQLTDP